MKKSILCVAAASALAFVACEPTKTVSWSVDEQQFSEARVLQVDTHAKIDSVQARLHVYLRVEWSKDYSPTQVESMDNDLNTLHGRAAFDLLKEFHADELVAPTWNVYTIVDPADEHRGWYRVEVIGFLARFEDWNGEKGVLDCNVDTEVVTHFDGDKEGTATIIRRDGTVVRGKNQQQR